MKKQLLTLSLVLAGLSTSFAQQEQLSWAKTVFGTNAQCMPSKMVLDAQGNAYVAGSFKESVDFDPGTGDQTINSVSNTWDAFVLKIDASGNFVWIKTFGGPDADIAMGITVDDAGNIYAAGIFRGEMNLPNQTTITSVAGDDIFIVKLNTQGDILTVKQLGGDLHENISDIKFRSGNIYATGSFSSSQLDFNPGAGQHILTSINESDIFVLKLTDALDFVWAKNFVNNTQKIANGEAIQVDAQGNVYTVGYFSQSIDFDPGPGTADLFGDGNFDGFISKLDANGNYVWAQTIGGTSSDLAADLALDEDANIYITGEYQGTVDFDPGAGVTNLTTTGNAIAPNAFVLKLDTDGGFIWAAQLGGDGHDRGISIALDPQRNVFTSGNYTKKADFDPGADSLFFTTTNLADVYISKLNSDGGFLWTGTVGGANSDINTDIAVDATGNIYHCGYYKTQMDADPNSGSTILNGGGGATDLFLLKISQADASVNELKKPSVFSIYPNPTTGQFTIELQETLHDADISIYDNTGRIILQKKLNATANYINVENMAAGNYFIRVKQGKIVETIQFIMQ